MAYTIQTYAASPLLGRIAGIYADLMERRAKYRVYRQTLSELSELTGRDLADLGIARSNLKSVAYEAAYK